MNEYIKDKTNNIDFKFYKFRNENRKIKLQHLKKICMYSNPSKYTSLQAAEKVVHFEFVYIGIEYT